MINWNYEELGFRSQKELEESIERVKAAKANPKNDLELRAENKAKFDAMNKNGGINFKGLEEGDRTPNTPHKILESGAKPVRRGDLQKTRRRFSYDPHPRKAGFYMGIPGTIIGTSQIQYNLDKRYIIELDIGKRIVLAASRLEPLKK